MMSRKVVKQNANVPRWTVPQEWAGERCFILAGGRSLKEQAASYSESCAAAQIAIKQAAAPSLR